MWTQATALLLACCLWPADAQSNRRQSLWEDPITFKTKSKDSCTMIITGLRQYTRLRVSCEGENSYWCNFMGKPQICRPYNKNPRHYFVQIMWGLRKLNHACQGPKRIRPHMCRNANDESQMMFSSSSFSSLAAISRPPGQPSKQQSKPAPARPHSARQASSKTTRLPPVNTTPSNTPQPPTPTPGTNAKSMSQQYCWRSLQGICSYVIGLFRGE